MFVLSRYRWREEKRQNFFFPSRSLLIQYIKKGIFFCSVSISLTTMEHKYMRKIYEITSQRSDLFLSYMYISVSSCKFYSFPFSWMYQTTSPTSICLHNHWAHPYIMPRWVFKCASDLFHSADVSHCLPREDSYVFNSYELLVDIKYVSPICHIYFHTR